MREIEQHHVAVSYYRSDDKFSKRSSIKKKEEEDGDERRRVAGAVWMQPQLPSRRLHTDGGGGTGCEGSSHQSGLARRGKREGE